ncbi:PadR family transcriptional regulator [Cellulosilyticum sp. WCF-2]|uniref:PadR family transcriptional regulator n=1 Tax=Cellulosilyticum sp. WCF-2 TaxID=2497860 RepID=UPI000F8CCB8B|nr:PadR family transcriptional regulator [Cellulosilyticum sp. WCF-2]QEH67547.1 PadR family transcriptional regulator [Cellulosilyticum sp. WCF-2]
MVRTLILYYLNIKATHGYEIQKFIQETGLEQWTQIKSGSIYYALSKLEKQEEITLVKEETHGSRVRRIYQITDLGKKTLHTLLEEKLNEELMPSASEKFVLPSMLNRLDKETAIEIINQHIQNLKAREDYWRYWQNMKVTKDSLKLDKLTFELPLVNLEYAIKWHEALIEEYDSIIELGKKQEQFIAGFNFDALEESHSLSNQNNRISELKKKILDQSQDSKMALDELITLLSNPQ